jgi:hypothetical protein
MAESLGTFRGRAASNWLVGAAIDAGRNPPMVQCFRMRTSEDFGGDSTFRALIIHLNRLQRLLPKPRRGCSTDGSAVFGVSI